MKKNNNGIMITSVALSTIIAVTSMGYTFNKKDSDKVVTTTIPTTSQVVVIDDDFNVKDSDALEAINSDIQNEEMQIYSLDELLLLLEKKYDKFDNVTQKHLRNLVEIVYKNGNDLSSILNRITDFEVSNFIINNIIKPLDTIKKIEVVAYDDYERLNELEYRTCYDDKKQEIRICNETENLNYQRLLEELMHTNQKDILSEVESGKEFDYADYLIHAEGEANVLSWPLVYGKICNDSSCLMFSDETYSDENIIYGTGYSYSAATKYYMYLVTLLGKDTLKEVRDTHDISIITNTLQKQYGINGNSFYNNMKDVVIDLDSNIDTKRTHMLVPIENTYLYCLEQKLEKIGNEKELLEFLDLYRYVNIQYGFIYNEFDENDNAIDCTAKKINKSIEFKLFEKLEEILAFNEFSNDLETRKKIFDALINPNRNSETSIYPVSLSNVSISFEESTNNIILEYDGSSIITNIDTKNSVVKYGTSISKGNNIFNITEEKII